MLLTPVQEDAVILTAMFFLACFLISLLIDKLGVNGELCDKMFNFIAQLVENGDLRLKF